MPVIELRTLGTLDLHSAEGRELHTLLAQPKRVALLAYLCIAQPHGFHRRDTLLGLFWPNSDQEHARASLRKSLHVLRRALGEDAILSRGDEEVAVDFARVSCDVVSFKDLIDGNRFQDALQVYGGDLLTGFFVDDAPEFEHWLHSERTRLRAYAARAAYAAAENLEKDGDLLGAERLARRSLELADTDERALRKLIELQFKAGNHTAAIESYEAFARSLAADYQTQPSTETRALIEQLRSASEHDGSDAAVSTPVGGHRLLQMTAGSLIGSENDNSRGPYKKRTWFIAGALGILISGGFVWGLMSPRTSDQVVRYVLAIDSSETMARGGSWWSRINISPDGTRLAYIGGPNGELLLRPRNQLHAVTLPGSAGAESPFFSPDGQSVGFLRERRVYVAPINGGPATAVCDSLTGVAGASWGPDGFIYVDGQWFVSLLRVEAKPGAVPQWFTTLDKKSGELDHTWPDVLPNGKGVLFTDTFVSSSGAKDSLSFAIAVAEIPSGKHRVILKDAKFARYASGYLLYVTTSKRLMAAPFDQESMRIVGEPRVLTDSLRVGVFGSTDLAVSTTGTLVYATSSDLDKRELAWVTRDGKAQAVDPAWLGEFWGPAISPDGKRLAIARRLNTPRFDILVKQLDRGPSIQLTLQKTDGVFPSWTPDGTAVTYTDNSIDSAAFWTIRADGSKPPVFVYREKRRVGSSVWTPDGKWLVYGTTPNEPDLGDILAIRPGIDKSPLPLVATHLREVTPSISADGRWLAYVSNESGQNEVYVVPFPDTHAAKWAVSTSGGTDPEWSHGGNELFYRDNEGNLMTVKVKTSPTFSRGRATRLFSTAGFEMLPAIKGYAVSPDDRRFLMIRPVPAAPDKLIVVENWFEELKPSNGRGRDRD
jgi:DNA-binding SARP family transcriptional activator